MSEDNQLTPSETKTLKEFAQDIMAAGRIKRKLTAWLLWLATSVGGGYAVWEFFLKHKG